MIELTSKQAAGLRFWFTPERRHLIGLHVLNSGRGKCLVDRWPEPRTVMVVLDTLCSLSGRPEALAPNDLREHASGLMHCPGVFLPILEKVFPHLRSIDRIVYELDGISTWSVHSGVSLRRLEASDTEKLLEIHPELHWISNTWGGMEGLSASGFAWAAFIDGKIAALAGTFLAADSLEDIGVVTERQHRSRGLATLCAAALCQDIHARGRRASWTTSLDNPASIRVAEKLGFQVVGPDVLYVLGGPGFS